MRELKGVLEAATNLAAGGDIEPEHLKLPRRRGRAPGPAGQADRAVRRARAARPTWSAGTSSRSTRRVGNNKSQAARVLAIGLQTLHRKLKAYGVK